MHHLILSSFLTVVCCSSGLSAVELDVRTSWLGNTFGGADGTFVQMDTRTLFVTTDGTCFMNVRWEEGGNNAGVYHDGKHLANPGWTHGWGNEGGFAVVADDRYVFIAQGRNNEGGGLRDPEVWPPAGQRWEVITRRTRSSHGRESAPFSGGKSARDGNRYLRGGTLVINETPWGKQGEPRISMPIRGLALHGDRLYIANPGNSEILVYHAERMERLARWEIAHARAMTTTADGTLWVVVGDLDDWGLRREGTDPARIHAFTPDGELLPLVITDVHSPTGLAVDNAGRLLVADNGPEQNIKIYDVTTARRVDTFGPVGGILSGEAGAITPDKLHGPQGVGVDGDGNVYVAGNGYGGNGSGATVASWTPVGAPRWRLDGLLFVDCGDFDRSRDGAVVYTPRERFSLDFAGTEPGSEWRYDAFTLDWQTYPLDIRQFRSPGPGLGSVWVRHFDGRTVIYGTDMYSSYLAGWIQPSERQIIQPFLYLDAGRTDDATLRSFAPAAVRDLPAKQRPAWSWRDADGDGQPSAAETHVAAQADPRTWAWWVDSDGDIWQAFQNARGEPIVRYRRGGLDAQGVPIYDFATRETQAAPAPFNDPAGGSAIERLVYESADDVLYLGGYTPERPNPGGSWKCVGTEIARYEQWSDQPRLAWRRALPFTWHEDVVRRDQPSAMATAGDLVFVVMGQRRLGEVFVYDAATGVELAVIIPDSHVVGDHVGWVDIPYGMNAMRRNDGEYLILVEEDFRAKNLLYRFHAPRQDAPLAPVDLIVSATGHLATLQWSAVTGARGYAIQRSDDDGATWTIVGHTNDTTTRFHDRAGTQGGDVSWRVLAVNWAGASPASRIVSATLAAAPILAVDFSDGVSPWPAVQVAPSPLPAHGIRERVGCVSGTAILPLRGFSLPAGTRAVTIRYDRYFARAPQSGEVRTHYSRQFLSFDTADGERQGQGQRFALTAEQAGRWHEITLTIPVPAGATAVRGGELNHLIEAPQAGYDNPVFINHIRITLE